MALDASGSLFIADRGNHRIRRVDVDTGVITTVAGTGTAGFSGDGGPSTSAELDDPWGVALDASGSLFIADTGVITTVAGTGTAGFSGDGGPSTSAELDDPRGVALDASGNLFIADRDNHRIRRVAAATGLIDTVAGSAEVGDGGPATNAQLSSPWSMALDASGDLFIADSSNHRVRRVDAATGVITTVAGIGAGGFSGDDGPASNAQLSFPLSVALDSSSNLFIVDSHNNRIRRVDSATRGFSDDGGPATNAELSFPSGVALDAVGNLFIADSSNDRVRRVDAATGVITTVAGTSTPGFSGRGARC